MSTVYQTGRRRGQTYRMINIVIGDVAKNLGNMFSMPVVFELIAQAEREHIRAMSIKAANRITQRLMLDMLSSFVE